MRHRLYKSGIPPRVADCRASGAAGVSAWIARSSLYRRFCGGLIALGRIPVAKTVDCPGRATFGGALRCTMILSIVLSIRLRAKFAAFVIRSAAVQRCAFGKPSGFHDSCFRI